MPKLYISEFASVAVDHSNRPVGAPLAPGIAEQAIEIGVESGQSQKFKGQSRFVMLKAEAACHLAFGEEPRATTEFHYVAAGEVRFYGIHPHHKLAVIAPL
jgi:hypothetical protein